MPATVHASPSYQNLEQLEELARSRISDMAFQYIVGGAEDEVTLRANRSAYQDYRFMPRVLRDVSDVRLGTTALGTKIAFPVIVAPTGFHRLCHPEGEVATAQGTSDGGTIFTASTIANCSLEDIAKGSDGPKWFQLYVFKDRGVTESLVKRAKKAGYKALVLTVDLPVHGRRERDMRTGFHLPKGLTMGNFPAGPLASRSGGDSSLKTFVAEQFDATLTWEDVKWLKKVSGLPVIVKGILHPDDAALAVKNGVDGVVVSNHGGRQLDHTVATLDALPAVVDAVEGRCEVFLDGGVRRGTDVLKAVALGARAVLVGRPVLWGLALGGRRGVAGVLDHLQREARTSMQILGAPSVADLDMSYLVPQASGKP